jgi:hypothetical protein
MMVDALLQMVQGFLQECNAKLHVKITSFIPLL